MIGSLETTQRHSGVEHLLTKVPPTGLIPIA